MARAISGTRHLRIRAVQAVGGMALLVGAIGAVPAAAPSAGAAGTGVVLSSGWTYTDLGPVSANGFSSAADINDAGVVVGASDLGAVRWVDGQPERLADPAWWGRP